MEGGGSSRIAGGPGSDFIESASGGDLIVGGTGADSLFGGRGDDVIRGGAGVDEVEPRGGDDIARGGKGGDFIRDQLGGCNRLSGGPGNDSVSVFNSGCSNIIIGGIGNDGLAGGGGDDLLLGGPGHDVLGGGTGDDTLRGGEGIDMAGFGSDFESRSVHADLATGIATGWGTDSLVAIEGLVGGAGDDVLIGNAQNNRLLGLFGDDMLDGGGGVDTVSFLYSGMNFGEWPGGPVTADLAVGTASGEGSDTLIGIENLRGSSLADTLIGDAGPNRLAGSDGNDTLSGLADDDLLHGGDGTDTGDGGTHLLGDACISVENATDCEQ
jgi:Ca2+-binding RTX toxin-like protein